MGILGGAIAIIALLLLWNYKALLVSEHQLCGAMAQAEAASRAKSRFLAHVSHEIRTPMNAILGHVQLMQMTAERSGTDREHLDIIEKSGDHLLSLISNVIQMAEIEAGAVHLESSTFGIRVLLDQIVQFLTMQCDKSRISISSEVSASVPEYVVADREKLHQVLANLADNAVRFTSRGSISLRCFCDESENDANPVVIHLEVVDTGQGIEPDALETVLEPFEQAAHGRRIGGGGLGLPISRHHVEAMGGAISVDSKAGVGTTVHIWLPVEVGRKEDADEVPDATGLGRGVVETRSPRILVVDDIETNLIVMRKLLECSRFEVLAVSNGPDAIESFSSWKPDVILMDRAMPEMDGIETMRRIRSMNGGADIPVIFVTGGALDEDQHEILAAGANDVILKPFRHSNLLEKIRKHLGR